MYVKCMYVNVCKVVMVAFKRWSLTRVYLYPLARGSNFMTLTGKIVLFWMDNCIWEVVTNGISTILLNFSPK